MRDCGGRREGRDKALTGSAKEVVSEVGLGSDKQGKGCDRVRQGTTGCKRERQGYDGGMRHYPPWRL